MPPFHDARLDFKSSVPSRPAKARGTAPKARFAGWSAPPTPPTTRDPRRIGMAPGRAVVQNASATRRNSRACIFSRVSASSAPEGSSASTRSGSRSSHRSRTARVPKPRDRPRVETTALTGRCRGTAFAKTARTPRPGGRRRRTKGQADPVTRHFREQADFFPVTREGILPLMRGGGAGNRRRHALRHRCRIRVDGRIDILAGLQGCNLALHLLYFRIRTVRPGVFAGGCRAFSAHAPPGSGPSRQGG